MKVKIIACMGANRVIGNNGKIPWKCADDMHFFKFMTYGKIVVMGRKTYDSLPNGPLSGRMNFIISSTSFETPPRSDKSFRRHMPSVEAAISEARQMENPDMDECWIIGGESIYKQALPISDEIYLNIMHQQFEGDTFFPAFENDYALQSSSRKQHFLSNHYKRIPVLFPG